MAELAAHWAYLQAAWRAARAAPLSLRRALLVAALADAYADQLFAASGQDDVLVFRADLAAASPALGLVFALCGQQPDGPRLGMATVPVPWPDYHTLSVEDFMVSLYNGHSVQRVMLLLPDGVQRPAHEVLGEALDALRPD